jgi:hypothetical protein
MSHKGPDSSCYEQLPIFPTDLTSTPGPLRTTLAQKRQEFGRVERSYQRLAKRRAALQGEIVRLVETLNQAK